MTFDQSQILKSGILGSCQQNLFSLGKEVWKWESPTDYWTLGKGYPYSISSQSFIWFPDFGRKNVVPDPLFQWVWKSLGVFLGNFEILLKMCLASLAITLYNGWKLLCTCSFFSHKLVGESVKWLRMREAKGKITAWLENPVNQNLPPKYSVKLSAL